MKTIQAVLPIIAADFARAERLLVPSLQHNIDCIETLWIIVPQCDVREAARRFPDATVVSEYDVVPSLRKVDRWRPLMWFGRLPLHLTTGQVVLPWAGTNSS